LFQLWTSVREAIYNLLYLGLMDDDQTILLLASRRVPELFELRQSYWFLAVTYFGGEHMKLNNDFLNDNGSKKEPVSLVRRIYRKIKKWIKR